MTYPSPNVGTNDTLLFEESPIEVPNEQEARVAYWPTEDPLDHPIDSHPTAQFCDHSNDDVACPPNVHVATPPDEPQENIPNGSLSRFYDDYLALDLYPKEACFLISKKICIRHGSRV